MKSNRKITLALAFALASLGACSSDGSDGEAAETETTEAEATETETETTETTEAEAASLFDQLPAEIQERGTIVFAGDSHPPYRTVESDGSVTGIDPDFQAALEAELGVEIEVEIAAGLPDILAGMLSGRYDAFNGPVRSTAEREADFDSIVWMTTRSSFLFLTENEGDIADSGALCGKSIAGVEGSVTQVNVERLNEWCAAEGLDAAEFVGLADTNATILAVESGRTDALATTETAALDIVAKNDGTFAYVTQTDEQGAGQDLLAMLTPKDSELGPVFLQAFENLFASGEYARIMETWGISAVALDEPLYNPATS